MKRDAESDIDKWMLKKATADVGRKRASSPSAAEERFGAYAFAPRHPREHLFCVSIHPLPTRQPRSARPPQRVRPRTESGRTSGRRVGGIRKSYATSGRTEADGQTEEPTAERASERATKRQLPTTQKPARSSLQAADIPAHRTAGREYCCLHRRAAAAAVMPNHYCSLVDLMPT